MPEDEDRRSAETQRRAEELREAWRRRRKPKEPPRKSRHGRRPEDDGKGRR